MLVLATPAVARTVHKDTSSGRSLRLWEPKKNIEVVNWRFFRAIGQCEQPAPANARMKNGRWPKRYMWGIDWHQTRNWSYPGGLGIWKPLWTEKGIAGTDMAPSADKATPREQMIQAQRIIDKYGKYAWGCTGVALARARFVDTKN